MNLIPPEYAKYMSIIKGINIKCPKCFAVVCVCFLKPLCFTRDMSHKIEIK